MGSNITEELSLDEIDNSISIITHLVENGDQFAALPKDKQVELMKICGQLARPDVYERKKRNNAVLRQKKQKKVSQERKARAATGIRIAREDSVFSAPLKLIEAPENEQVPLTLNSPRNCYVCKDPFTKLHHFYDTMCPSCAEFNYQKRFQRADLRGQVAVITGSRLKIGYHVTLMMLRSGARVIATTRFPVDSLLRYSKEFDFQDWKDRLHIYGLDLRHIPSVELFCEHIEEKFGTLDILINNAAQTVRRPPAFYEHLMENERLSYEQLPNEAKELLYNHQELIKKLKNPALTGNSSSIVPAVSWNGKTPGLGLRSSAELSQIPYGSEDPSINRELFPKGQLDVDLQQVDLSTVNSWRLKLGEIETSEMIELQLVNSIAPFVLCNKLSLLMKKKYTGKKHIVNVSAMEGKFQRFKKNSRHPHTNMAKAALNMLTHTSSGELAKHGIFMNAVDTGWVTDEDPAQLSKLKEELHDFQPPLDIVDGAARVCDPIFDGINSGKHWCGKFLKDYFPIDW